MIRRSVGPVLGGFCALAIFIIGMGIGQRLAAYSIEHTAKQSSGSVGDRAQDAAYGNKSGFEWAQSKHLQSKAQCREQSNSDFRDGCETYAGLIDTVPEVHDGRATFGEFDCSGSCSGHMAGYTWGRAHRVRDPNLCTGRSRSFVEGCTVAVTDGMIEDSLTTETTTKGSAQ